MRNIYRNVFNSSRVSSATLGTALAVTAAVAWCNPAQATTLNFDNEYYVSASGEFSTLFPGASGYGTAGIYQETNTSTPTVTKLATGGAPGEYVQNTTPNANQGISLTGWGISANNGTPLANNVYNLQNPANGTVLYMQFKSGVTPPFISTGTTTPYNFNSIQFRGATANANLNFTLEGFSGGVLQDTALLDVTGNTFTTFTENWANIDTVEIVSTASLPVNWGSGTLYLGAVEYNAPIAPAVPELSTWAMIVLGFAGMGLLGFRRQNNLGYRQNNMDFRFV
jgi:hypothetical protein